MEIRYGENFHSSIYYFVTKAGPRDLFGQDRERLSHDEAVKKFDDFWSGGFKQAALKAPICDAETAREQIREYERRYLKEDKAHRTVRYKSKIFIIQLNLLDSNLYEIEQVWFVESQDHNPLNICVTFPSAESKEQFDAAAKSQGYRSGKQLLEKLVQDFMIDQGLRWDI